MLFGGVDVQSRATYKGVARETNDGAIPTEGEPVHRLVGQIAKHLRLRERDAELHEHLEFACSDTRAVVPVDRGFGKGAQSGQPRCGLTPKSHPSPSIPTYCINNRLLVI